MIKSILVPMGSSRFSSCALKLAAGLSSRFGAKIQLMYVEDISKIKNIALAFKGAGGVSLDLPILGQEVEQVREIRQEIEAEKREVWRMYDEIKPQIKSQHAFLSREGEVSEEILCETRKVDLVVMGKSLLKDAVDCRQVQSALIRVIQRTNKPVLAVCENQDIGNRFLVAYDGSRAANNALRTLGDFLPFTSPEITILAVKKTEWDARSVLGEGEQYFEPYGIRAEKIWKTGSASENIIATAREKGASMIVMGGYGENKLRELLIGSTTEKVLKGVDIPVLVAPAV
ncbi:MAG: universal stress protein [Armatimonadetes bacterium]|nr:universal stress protein [Armatimonadota bacterium]